MLTRDWPVADNTQHSLEADIIDPGGVRTLYPSKRAVAYRRVGPLDHWGRHRGQIYLIT